MAPFTLPLQICGQAQIVLSGLCTRCLETRSCIYLIITIFDIPIRMLQKNVSCTLKGCTYAIVFLVQYISQKQ